MHSAVKGLVLAFCLSDAMPALGFGGFFVASADSVIKGKSAEVILVRDGHRTVMTLVPHFTGTATDFAFVVAVPVVLERKQIHIGDVSAVQRLNAYTAPRLVEYVDENPCNLEKGLRSASKRPSKTNAPPKLEPSSRNDVNIETSYVVGDYEIAILSARESDGLSAWLRQNGYKLPAGATSVFASYIKRGMKFFVARGKRGGSDAKGDSVLRPLQVAFESETLELPLQLGSVNSEEVQDTLIFGLSRRGRMEVSNYETVKLPTGMELPVFVKDVFPKFYADMFSTLTHEDTKTKVYMEYAWEAGWCDPCAAEPLTYEELRSLGVYWAKENPPRKGGDSVARDQDVFVTRLHTRYTNSTLAKDLQFRETDDRNTFQSRYVIRHPFEGKSDCPRYDAYRQELAKSKEKQAAALASLTNWPDEKIRQKMSLTIEPGRDADWIDRVWGDH